MPRATGAPLHRRLHGAHCDEQNTTSVKLPVRKFVKRNSPALVRVVSKSRSRRDSMSTVGLIATSAATFHASAGNWTTSSPPPTNASSASKSPRNAGSGGGGTNEDLSVESFAYGELERRSPAAASARDPSATRQVPIARSRSSNGSSPVPRVPRVPTQLARARPASTATSLSVSADNSTSRREVASNGETAETAIDWSPSAVPSWGIYANRAMARTASQSTSAFGFSRLVSTTAVETPRSAENATDRLGSADAISSTSSTDLHPVTPRARPLPSASAPPSASAIAHRLWSLWSPIPFAALNAETNGFNTSDLSLETGAFDRTLYATSFRPPAATATTSASVCAHAATRHSLATPHTRLHASRTRPEL